MQRIDLDTVIDKPNVIECKCEYINHLNNDKRTIGSIIDTLKYKSDLTIGELIEKWAKRCRNKIMCHIVYVTLSLTDDRKNMFTIEYDFVDHFLKVTFNKKCKD